ncbi:nitrogen fixation protein-like protein [Synechococcus phage S-SZBM1]|uniref:Nitrogen fixation protein-like protein n=1 Tax=Synechococcus phage S-SZBM1 TaxID=2926475 RepID=A0AC61TSM8_9CAUD|nr:nitrogen fixation protein-like protein [Synechococcus phage S-SZBM1]UNH61224.1 nitrogen fixation protein-like protein [Synechococcus phage S-SZBM1]
MVMKKRKTAWRLWALSLGEKAGKNDREANTIAIIRTIIFATYLITNVAIVANAIRHWNDVDYTRPIVEKKQNESN